MTSLDSRVLHEVSDGSRGPLLRIADDRLAPGAGYGRHAHRDVDVVAVVVSGSLVHAWEPAAALGAGDVGVLRAGAGLEHDEVAGPDGAHVVQTYLRAAGPGRPAEHRVLSAPEGWVDLGRADARLWTARLGAGDAVHPPEGLVVTAGGPVERDAGGLRAGSSGVTVLVWQLDTARPSWAG